MELVDQYRILIGGYYGVSLMDSYPLKEYILNDIKKYTEEYMNENPLDGFNYLEESNNIKDKTPKKRKLQDALLVLNMINGPMDLVFMIKDELKKYNHKTDN